MGLFCNLLSLFTNLSPSSSLFHFGGLSSSSFLLQIEKQSFSSQNNEIAEGLTYIKGGMCAELGRTYFFSSVKERVRA